MFDTDFWITLLGLFAAYITVIWALFEFVGIFCECDPEYESGVCDGAVARRNLDTGEVQKRVRKGDTYRWASIPVCAWSEFVSDV